MTPKESSELDQALATMVDLIPRGAKGMYDGFIEQGFTESQAMELTKVWVANPFSTGSGNTGDD